MSERNKHIDDLFKEALGGYNETPPPAVWDALEQRLDDDNNPGGGGGGRPAFPYRWLWYIGALLLVVVAGVTVWSVTRESGLDSKDVVKTADIQQGANTKTKNVDEPSRDEDININADDNSSDAGSDNVDDNNNNQHINDNTPDAKTKNNTPDTKPQSKAIDNNAGPQTKKEATTKNANTKTVDNKNTDNNNKQKTTNKPQTKPEPIAAVPKTDAKTKAPATKKPTTKNTDNTNKTTDNSNTQKTTNKPQAKPQQIAAAPKTDTKTTVPSTKPATKNTNETTKPKPKATDNQAQTKKADTKSVDNTDNSNTQKTTNKPQAKPEQIAAAPKADAKATATAPNKPAVKNTDEAAKPKSTTNNADKQKPEVATDDKVTDEQTDNKTTTPKTEDNKQTNNSANKSAPKTNQKAVAKEQEKVDKKTEAPKTNSNKILDRDYLKVQTEDDADSSGLDPFFNGGDLTPDGDYKAWNKNKKHKKYKSKNKDKDKGSAGNPFGLGISVGYEYGFDNSFKADKILFAPYVQYKFSSQFSLLFQPAYLMGFVKANNIASGTDIYYNPISAKADSVSVVLPADTSASPPPWFDTINTTYTYLRTYDSTVVSRQFSQKQLWEAELPLMLQYKVSENFSVFGGVSLTFSKVLRTEEIRVDYRGIKDSLQTTNTLTYIRNQPGTPPPAQDPNVVFGGYTGSPISTYEPMVSSGNTTMFTRFGYNFGFNATVRERFIIGLSYQQKFANSSQIPNESLRKIYSQPYIRMTIGYKIFK